MGILRAHTGAIGCTVLIHFNTWILLLLAAFTAGKELLYFSTIMF